MGLRSWLRLLFAPKPQEPPEPPPGSTTCATCGLPITPGELVAHAWIGAPYPYTHATFQCDKSGGAMYGGTWGNGKFLPDPRLIAS
jgi:hypothetical protein